MGHEAWQMIGRTPGYIVAVRPLRKGAITDFDITQRMIRLLLQRAGCPASTGRECSSAFLPPSRRWSDGRSRRRPEGRAPTAPT